MNERWLDDVARDDFGDSQTQRRPLPPVLGPDNEELRQAVIKALRKIYDPEIPINIYDLGLIYEVKADVNGTVHVLMTLTAPGCPVAQTFPGMVESHILGLPGVNSAYVELVWDPPWTRERMSEAALLQLGMF